MTPHGVLALLDTEQIAGVMCACAQFLPVDRIERALREGLDEVERRQLAYQLSIEFELE